MTYQLAIEDGFPVFLEADGVVKFTDGFRGHEGFEKVDHIARYRDVGQEVRAVVAENGGHLVGFQQEGVDQDAPPGGVQKRQDERVNGPVFDEAPDNVGRFIAIKQRGKHLQSVLRRAAAEQIDVVLPAVGHELSVRRQVIPRRGEAEVGH